MVGFKNSRTGAIVTFMLIFLMGSSVVLSEDFDNPYGIDGGKVGHSYITTGSSSNINWSTEFAYPGFNNAALASTIFNGELYVAGYFSTVHNISSPALAKWDGAAWLPIITDFVTFTGGNISITALVEYNGELIVTGSFVSIDGVPCVNIAAWNGSSWRAIKNTNTLSSNITNLAVYNNELIVGGSFTEVDGVASISLAKWDGTTWSDMGAGIDLNSYGQDYHHKIEVLKVHNNELYVGGTFESSYGQGLIKWDGTSWSGLGSGLNNYGNLFSVYDVTTHNSSLIAGGDFTYADGLSIDKLAEWDGSSWSSLGFVSATPVGSVTSYNNKLYASSKDGISEYDNGNWNIIQGTEGFYAQKEMFEYNSELVMLGNQMNISNVSDFVTKWDGSNWSTFDSYLGNGTDGWVMDMVTYNNKLVCVGEFDRVGDIGAKDMALWDGISWESLQKLIPKVDKAPWKRRAKTWGRSARA